MHNIVCVWAGDTYSEEYVRRLADFAHLYTTKQITFVCFTDKPRETIAGVEFRLMPTMQFVSGKLWWYKIYIFSRQAGLSGDCLYLDLDVVPLKPLDLLLEYNAPFVILQDFNRVFNKNYAVSNSSMIKWRPEAAHYIWDQFKGQIHDITTKYRGDQDYITRIIGTQKTWWPKEYACSFKWEWLTAPAYMEPYVLVFHGNPKPEDFGFDLTKMIKDKNDRLSKNKIYR
jgi:hypothetical protein